MFVVIRFIKSNIDFRYFLIFFDFEKIVFVCFFFEKLDLVEMKVDFKKSGQIYLKISTDAIKLDKNKQNHFLMI